MANQPSQNSSVSPKLKLIRTKLAKWYRANKREMPWRETGNPYFVWLSEVMSQQTTIKAVIPYFEKFVTEFPTVEDLAKAPLEKVLELWAGLGYYRRARNLHAAAKQFAINGFPSTANELKAYPGIGEYTAAAIASIVFDEHAAVVDGNVERVVSRLFALRGDPGRGETKKAIRKHAQLLVEQTIPGEHNQAMMELGSLICRPKNQATCLICPVKNECMALQQSLVSILPEKPTRKKPALRTDRALAIFNQDKLLFGKIPANQVWGGLLEMPRAIVLRQGETESKTLLQSITAIARSTIHKKPILISESPIATIKHGVMNERITLEIYPVKIKGKIHAHEYDSLHWLSAAEVKTAALSSPQRKAQKAIWQWHTTQ